MAGYKPAGRSVALSAMSTTERVKCDFRAGTSDEIACKSQAPHKVAESGNGKMCSSGNRPGAVAAARGATQEGALPMPAQRIERKYALTRVKAGDYLFPSNDGRTLWRVYSYEESGDGEWCRNGKWVKIVGTYWALSKYDPYGPVDLARLPDDFLEWDRWSSHGSLYETRQDAINDALRISEATS